MNLKPNRKHDPNIDGELDGPLDDEEYLDALNAPPPTPLSPEDFRRLGDELQAAVDLAQSRMRICPEPEFSALSTELVKAQNALTTLYENRGVDALFSEGAERDAYALREVEVKMQRAREDASERQRVSRERKKDSRRQYRT